jgi:dihydrofolate reductase
MINYSSNAT